MGKITPPTGEPEATDNSPRPADGEQPEQQPGELRTDLVPEDDD